MSDYENQLNIVSINKKITEERLADLRDLHTCVNVIPMAKMARRIFNVKAHF
jgi:hypothetical protein